MALYLWKRHLNGFSPFAVLPSLTRDLYRSLECWALPWWYHLWRVPWTTVIVTQLKMSCKLRFFSMAYKAKTGGTSPGHRKCPMPHLPFLCPSEVGNVLTAELFKLGEAPLVTNKNYHKPARTLFILFFLARLTDDGTVLKIFRYFDNFLAILN